MRKEYFLALYIHPSRLEEAVSLIKAHSTECASLGVLCGGENANELKASCDVPITVTISNYRKWDEQLQQLIAQSQIQGLIFLADKTVRISENEAMMRLLQQGIDEDIPIAANISSAEALIHLMYEYPEALSGHHLAAQYLEENAYKH